MAKWSFIRNKLEKDYLCPSLRGRIQYFTTGYTKSPDREGRAAIRLDGREILRSSYYAYYQSYWERYRRLSARGRPQKQICQAANRAALNDGCFDNRLFYKAFEIFDNQSIEKSLVSDNPIVRIFALLDRRTGKRRLLALSDKMESEIEWVRRFYLVRLQAEGLLPRETPPEKPVDF